MWNFMFFFNSILLGIGLAMDAFSVSLANGLHEPTMRKRRMGLIAGIFAGFQQGIGGLLTEFSFIDRQHTPELPPFADHRAAQRRPVGAFGFQRPAEYSNVTVDDFSGGFACGIDFGDEKYFQFRYPVHGGGDRHGIVAVKDDLGGILLQMTLGIKFRSVP